MKTIVICGKSRWVEFATSLIKKEYKVIQCRSEKMLKVYSLFYKDFLIVDNQINYEILSKKEHVFNMYEFYKFYFIDNPLFYEIHTKAKKMHGEIETIATGMSYIMCGIDGEVANNKLANIAYSSQDIFFDFELFKYYFLKEENIRSVIIGLAPYSLRYDESLSKSENYRIKIYWPLIKKTHHYNIKIDESIRNWNYIEKYFMDDYINKAFLFYEETYGIVREWNANWKNKKFVWDNVTEQEILVIQEEIRQKFNKPYSETYKENVKILKDYLEFCKENEVAVKIVIPPYTNIYYSNMNKEYYAELQKELIKFKTIYDFELYDLVECKDFSEDDFRDYCHLNKKGANKLTKLIMLEQREDSTYEKNLSLYKSK